MKIIRSNNGMRWHIKDGRGCSHASSVVPTEDYQKVEGTPEEILEHIQNDPGEPCPNCDWPNP